MIILITGIHGFVGTNLVAALKNKYSIYGLDIIAPQKEGVITTFSWQHMEDGNIPPVDVIIHLAGKAHDTKNQSKAQEYFDINTGLTQRIFDYFLRSSTRKFIFFSSVKAAADFVTGNELTEAVIPTPKGPYGESKIAAENYIREHFTSYCAHLPATKISDTRKDFEIEKQQGSAWEDAANGKQAYILRPCMIHGPGNKGNLNLLYNIVKKGIPWPLGDFENRRTFTSIDNLCYVVDGIISKNISSGIYHMADDEALSTNELIKIMCEAMGTKAHIWNIRKSFMTGCAKIGTSIGLPLNMERLAKLTENYVVSNAKIKKALEIDRMPVKAKDGLIKTIKSF